MRILLIEDNAELARQIKSTLEHARYAVDVAFDGEEGLFLGESEPYDAANWMNAWNGCTALPKSFIPVGWSGFRRGNSYLLFFTLN